VGWENCIARGRGAGTGRHGDEVHRELPDQLACLELEYHLQEKFRNVFQQLFLVVLEMREINKINVPTTIFGVVGGGVHNVYLKNVAVFYKTTPCIHHVLA
jgi:hypothetical protein